MTRSVLLIGESDVGKTHYGAQVLRRLNSGIGMFELVVGTNLEPFRIALDQISLGLSAPHTPVSEFSESVWKLRQKCTRNELDVVWYDYGGEQVTEIINQKFLPSSWRHRIFGASGWILMVRPSQVLLPEDILTRGASSLPSGDVSRTSLTPQSKQIEILQMLRYKKLSYSDHEDSIPPLIVLLSCYDELETEYPPSTYCQKKLPMLFQYVTSNWDSDRRRILAVSPLGTRLSDREPNQDFVSSGPENNGFVIDEHGTRSEDLLSPLEWIFSNPEPF